MTDARIAELGKIGFEWKVVETAKNVSWNQRFQELKEYKKLIETYRSEIGGMQRNLETLNNDNLK